MLEKYLCVNFDMTILTQSMGIEQSFVIWILIALLFTLKPKIFEDISNEAERWFDTSNYNENDKRPLPIGKNKKVPGLFKDELGGKIITEVVALRPKTYAYLMDDGTNHKKAKGTKKLCLKIKKIACLIIKLHIDHREDLKAIMMLCTQK